MAGTIIEVAAHPRRDPDGREISSAMRITVAIFVITTIAGIAASASWANATQNRFTSIANKDCTFAPIGNEPEDAEDQLKTCPGVGGAQVLVNALGTRLRIGFRWPKGGQPQKIIWAVEAWSAGLTINWRGSGNDKTFEPYAAIVRMKFQKQDLPVAGDQILAVIRIAPDTACVMGAVDAGANPNANEAAHALADAAPSFACGKDKPTIGGVSTRAAEEIARGIAEQ
ncbi:hypothetical protein NWI01_20300 [Nitrobacter winogradskyi]|uniref:Uncharacterized protein n=2 Tax=Nitrobacter winogradskyi TaxID=913 RepID=A0A4Y3WCC0_NITWI|nr:hypothetical protein NWI01_20300 [Nitrobacter winogradskyi]